MPLFSIIIPTFNSQATINVCLNSILVQDFGDFEIVIQDGMSKDNTLQIVKDYDDSRIKLFIENDTGVYDAMNKAIDKAKGEWLYFLGSDDCLYNEKVLSVVKESIANEPTTNFLYGNSWMVGRKMAYNGFFTREKLLTDSNFSHQAIFYKSDLFSRLGNYSLDFKIWADWDFNIRCFSWPGLRPLYIDKIIAVYNDIDGLSSRVPDDEVMLKLLPLNRKINNEIDLFKLKSIDYKLGRFFLDKVRFFRNLFKKKSK